VNEFCISATSEVLLISVTQWMAIPIDFFWQLFLSGPLVSNLMLTLGGAVENYETSGTSLEGM